MSADNYLYITRDNKVHDLNGSTDYTREQIDNRPPLYKASSLEDAVRFCNSYIREGAVVEYGIHFEDRTPRE